jgi:glycosyltransferase involved in cell wall biosynthesis
MSPDFTIITPSLNYGQFLADCLASVANQEGVSFEHLVFDGGSTDNSAEVAARECRMRSTKASNGPGASG